MWKREIDDEGRIECGLCGEGIYIWNYYCRKVIEGLTKIDDIWFEKDGKLYGRPKSYCRACNIFSNKGKDAIVERRLECQARRANRIENRDEACQDALQNMDHIEGQALLKEWNKFRFGEFHYAVVKVRY